MPLAEHRVHRLFADLGSLNLEAQCAKRLLDPYDGLGSGFISVQ
jgi:hypothetical protein